MNAAGARFAVTRFWAEFTRCFVCIHSNFVCIHSNLVGEQSVHRLRSVEFRLKPLGRGVNANADRLR